MRDAHAPQPLTGTNQRRVADRLGDHLLSPAERPLNGRLTRFSKPERPDVTEHVFFFFSCSKEE